MNRWWQPPVLVAVLTMGTVSTALFGQTSTVSERNRQLVSRHLELMNRGDWKQAADLFAPDVRHHLGNWQTGEERIVRGKDVLAANLADIFRTFPDWRMDVVEMIADGESVVVRCRVSGTHRGVASARVNGGLLVGVPPTGRHFVVQHIHWYKVRDGKITDHATNRDDLGMMQQLGLLSTSPTTPADSRH